MFQIEKMLCVYVEKNCFKKVAYRVSVGLGFLGGSRIDPAFVGEDLITPFLGRKFPRVGSFLLHKKVDVFGMFLLQLLSTLTHTLLSLSFFSFLLLARFLSLCFILWFTSSACFALLCSFFLPLHLVRRRF